MVIVYFWSTFFPQHACLFEPQRLHLKKQSKEKTAGTVFFWVSHSFGFPSLEGQKQKPEFRGRLFSWMMCRGNTDGIWFSAQPCSHSFWSRLQSGSKGEFSFFLFFFFLKTRDIPKILQSASLNTHIHKTAPKQWNIQKTSPFSFMIYCMYTLKTGSFLFFRNRQKQNLNPLPASDLQTPFMSI